MKQYSFFLFLFILLQNSLFAQVGIGTTTPNEMLEVNGNVRITDGNQAEGKLLMSDANGSGHWEDVTGGVYTKVLRLVNSGSATDVIIWMHNGIQVRLDTATETVTVENISGDAIHYWDIVINGGANSIATREVPDYIFKFIRDEGTANDLVSLDIGNDNRGWFRVIASSQQHEQSGFILNIVYFADDINGMVQYWDAP